MRFSRACARAVAPGAIVVFFDNRYVEGSSTPLSRRDAQGNTYQARKLDNGSAHEVLKNFPTERELVERASAHGLEAKVEWLEYYWLLTYRTRAMAERPIEIAPPDISRYRSGNTGVDYVTRSIRKAGREA
jgi:demethylmenaquinone methyltransferase/2-methoxy-6-polyprenyl-1,4-benzoquinol methylase